MEKYVNACVFVSQMVKKHNAARFWVWEVLETERGIIKGTGAVLEKEDCKEIESIIISGLSGEW